MLQPPSTVIPSAEPGTSGGPDQMDSQTQTGAPAHKQSHLPQHCHAVQFGLSDPNREGSRKEDLFEKYFLD